MPPHLLLFAALCVVRLIAAPCRCIFVVVQLWDTAVVVGPGMWFPSTVCRCAGCRRSTETLCLCLQGLGAQAGATVPAKAGFPIKPTDAFAAWNGEKMFINLDDTNSTDEPVIHVPGGKWEDHSYKHAARTLWNYQVPCWNIQP